MELGDHGRVDGALFPAWSSTRSPHRAPFSPNDTGWPLHLLPWAKGDPTSHNGDTGERQKIRLGVLHDTLGMGSYPRRSTSLCPAPSPAPNPRSKLGGGWRVLHHELSQSWIFSLIWAGLGGALLGAQLSQCSQLRPCASFQPFRMNQKDARARIPAAKQGSDGFSWAPSAHPRVLG